MFAIVQSSGGPSGRLGLVFIGNSQACSRCFRSPRGGSLVAFLLLTVLAGCGGGGSGGSAGVAAAADTTAPTVTSMTPGEDTAALGTNSPLTVTFSEAMVPDAINTNTFRLTDGVSAVPGTVSFDAVNHIAVFTPTASLAPNTRYTATMVTGIEDLAGNPLITDFAWCFVTSGTADTSGPVTTATEPADAATDVALNQKIRATFSEDMSAPSLTPGRFTVMGPGIAPVAGAVTYRGRTAIFTPVRALAPNTGYTATLAADIEDLAGNAVPAAVTWGFSTRANADTTPPVAVATNPADAALDVAISAVISVTLSEPLDPATVTTATFTVTGPGTLPVIGTVAFDAATNTATFTRLNHLNTPVAFHPAPVSNLDAGTTYIATLGPGARDMAGNALGSPVVWSFTTAP